MKPLVSAIIPNYNYAQYVAEAVESALDQTYESLEVIVVDDGSKDGSLEVLEKFGDRIKVITKQNAGVSAARNTGVAASSGEYVAFLDADDAWLPEKIEKQLELFTTVTSVGMVHTGVVEVDESGARLRDDTNGMEGSVSGELLLFERPVILGGGSGIVVSRKAFEEAGGFDTRLSTSADWDFFYRIASRFSVGFVPDALLRYRIHGTNMHGNIAAMEHDMLLSYDKAFADGPQADKRRCYGNLHKVLAGSYYRAGQYRGFIRHAIKCLSKTPDHFGHFALFPFREFRRYGR